MYTGGVYLQCSPLSLVLGMQVFMALLSVTVQRSDLFHNAYSVIGRVDGTEHHFLRTPQ